jgi:DNA-binding MarR family transcriptional regulator
MAETPNADLTEPIPGVDPDADPLDLLEWALAVFTRRLEQAARRSELHGELDRAGYLLARTLDDAGPITVNELAEHLGLDGSTVTRQISALERRGFVERAVDPDDRRSRILQLTPRGRRTMRSVRDARRQRIGDAVDGWSADDVATFGRLMDRLNHELGR